jgi:glycosyltransferase involved in cell wall biosynthesis
MSTVRSFIACRPSAHLDFSACRFGDRAREPGDKHPHPSSVAYNRDHASGCTQGSGPHVRVLLDAHQLGRRETGDETYIREVLTALRAYPEVEILAAVEGDPHPTGPLASPVRLRRVPRNGLARLAALSLVAHTASVDLLHAVYVLPAFVGRPSVVTIHDISFERYPEFFSRRFRLRDRLFIRDAARRASRVITVSETSRRDLVELWRVPADRVVAIHNGVDEIFGPGPNEPEEGSLDPLRVLAVGTLQPRKNLGRLLDALAIVARRRRVLLRVVGPDGYQAEAIRSRLAGRAEVEVLGYVDRAALADEYRRAHLLAYPSLYEGFGLPVVEAMASGTPVVTTSGGSLPEVVADAALIVDPLDVSAIAAAIERVADDGALRAELRLRGLARAREFTWATAARRHVETYASLLG